jgi:predicted dehydrogenase
MKRRWTRRKFLRQAAFALALPAVPSIVPSTVIGADGAVPPSERITVGYIGTGAQGRGANINELLQCRDAQVVAICDVYKKYRDLGKAMVDAAYKNQDCKAYIDFRELLARDDIDAVGIAAPDHWHVPMAVAAMKAGKDVHVEKPLGICLAQDLVCRDVVQRYGRVFQYGAESRTNANCRLACELVRNGRIGEIRELLVQAPDLGVGRDPGPVQPAPPESEFHWDLFLGPAAWRPFTGVPIAGMPSPWYFFREFSVGWISNWAAHLLDLLQWGYDTHLAGLIEVEGTGKPYSQFGHDQITGWQAQIRFGNGVKMTFRPGSDLTRFIGTEGEISLAYNRLADEKTKALVEASRSVPLARRLKDSSGGHEHHWVHCVKTRSRSASPVEDAVRSDTIAHLTEIAIRVGRKITWDPVKEVIVGDPDAARYLTRPMREPWQL